MIFLFFYLISGIIIARFIERKKYHVALIAHAVMFTVLLFFILIVSDDVAISSMMEGLLGQEVVSALRQATFLDIAERQTVDYTMIAYEIAVLLLSIMTMLISLDTAIEKGFIGEVRRMVSIQTKQLFGCGSEESKRYYQKNSIFRMNCRMNT